MKTFKEIVHDQINKIVDGYLETLGYDDIVNDWFEENADDIENTIRDLTDEAVHRHLQDLLDIPF